MRSFHWVQHFTEVETNLSFSNIREYIYIYLSYLLGNKKKEYFIAEKYEGAFLLIKISGIASYLGCFNKNSKEWEELNLSYCRKIAI